jgi:ribosomal protein S12 methylthiotransferase accessory factor
LEQDKACSPEETVATVSKRLSKLEKTGILLLESLKRVDVGRLNIPVYMSLCASQAKEFMPTRKQMGKGATEAQAKASALMELMERFAFFSYWQQTPTAICTWSEARARFGANLMPLEEIARAVDDPLPLDKVRAAMDLAEWEFRPVTDLAGGREYMAPVGWFRKLAEFNGSSAGNTPEESLFQGACELVERHVCAVIDRTRPELSTINASAVKDPVLLELLAKFERENIFLLLKDFSLDMGVPTVGALAYDPKNFPQRSEIVFTAGTASSPEKAAIRAITEVAQLAGDFLTNACYEPSGLPKFSNLAAVEWLLKGPKIKLENLPSIQCPDFRDELMAIAAELKAHGLTLYAVDTTNFMTEVPSHYSFAPGLQFRQRDANASVGLFVGRVLAEEENPEKAVPALAVLDQLYGGAPFTPFFMGTLALRTGDLVAARSSFAAAIPLQQGEDARGMACFYLGYSYTQSGMWN